MILLADESIERTIVDLLRSAGWQILYIAEMEPGISDDLVLQLANENRALLLTADKDFGELVYRLGRLHTGVVLLRLAGLPAAAKARAVLAVIQQHQTEIEDAFSVISPNVVRIRHRS